jgi:hypothetical protein
MYTAPRSQSTRWDARQKKSAETIVEGAGDCILALKDNQPAMRQEVEQFFESARAETLRDTPSAQAQSIDGDDGRIDIRLLSDESHR